GTGRPVEGMAHARRAIGLLDLPGVQHWLGLVYHDLAINAVTAGDLDAACEVIAWTHALRGEVSEAIDVAGRGLTLSGDVMTSSLLSGAMATAELERG